MQKGLGLTALALAVIAVFVPVVGPWLTLVAAGFAAFAWGGGFPLGVSALALNVVNVLLLSPSLWLAAGVEAAARPQGGGSVFVFGVFLLGAQLAAAVALVMLHRRRKA